MNKVQIFSSECIHWQCVFELFFSKQLDIILKLPLLCKPGRCDTSLCKLCAESADNGFR